MASGSLFAKDDGRLQRIGRVLVDPARRGEGWGRLVMELLLARTDANPAVHATELGVFTHNAAARELYQRLGFVRTPGGTTVVVDDQTWHSEEFTRPSRPQPRPTESVPRCRPPSRGVDWRGRARSLRMPPAHHLNK